MASCNILNYFSDRVCAPNKIEDLNLNVFNIAPRISKLKILQNSCHANVNANLIIKNVTQIKTGITINVSVSAKIQSNVMWAKKIIF